MTAPKPPRRASRARPGFVYSRYANPTVAMFEERMALLEGAEAARGTASGMAAVTAALLCESRPAIMSSPRGRCSAPATISSPIVCRASGSSSTLVDGTDLDAWRGAVRRDHAPSFMETPSNPDLETDRHRRGRGHRPARRRAADRRQCLRHAAVPAAAANSAPIRWSIPPPSILTVRAAVSVASFCRTRSGLRKSSRPI